MDKHQKQKLRAKIEVRIGQLQADIRAYKNLVRPIAPDNAIGRLTRMEAINSKSINEAALLKARDSLASLVRALAKIDDPDFGLCLECEEPIPPARLMILPETDLCVQCAASLTG